MKFFALLSIFFCIQNLFAAQISPLKRGLVVIIHQEHLNGLPDAQAAALPMMLAKIPTKDFGALGEVLELFRQECAGKSTKQEIIDAFDTSRQYWALKYLRADQNIYLVIGADAENPDHMKTEYGKAIADNDVVDVISIVHGGREFIGLPDDMSKVRLFYTSACSSKDGRDLFIAKGVRAYVGHNSLSASPFFTHAIMKNWLLGKDVTTTINEAWEEGAAIIKTPQGQMLAKLLGGYQGGAHDILTQSQISYTLCGIDGDDLNIDSPLTARDATDIVHHDIR